MRVYFPSAGPLGWRAHVGLKPLTPYKYEKNKPRSRKAVKAITNRDFELYSN